jgi:hypothetical protein
LERLNGANSMADNNFRPYGSRDGRARVEAPRESASDPLAELARLIGQGDPYAEHGSGRSQDHAAAPGFDWAANEDYAEPPAHVEEHYAPPPPPLPPAAFARDEQDYEAEALASGQYFSGPSAKFNGFGADNEAEQLGPVLPPRQFPAFMSPAPADRYENEAPAHPQEAGEDYGDYADDYYEEPSRPRQRGGLVVMMAVLGLVIVGTAGAFAYRAMFGTVAFPSLPPIIKASIAPNKIVPSTADAQTDYAKAAAATQAAADKLVSREEQPVSMEPPKVGSRVVATIPISGGQQPPPPALAAPAPAAAGTSAPSFNTAAAPDATAAAPPPMTVAATPPAAPAPSEPRKVRTVVIRSDQSAAAGLQVAAPAPRSARPSASANRTGTSAAAAPVGANAPLSIVPAAEGEAVMPAPVAPAPIASAPSRSRAAAAAPIALASAEPAAAVPASAPSTGGYAVQVTSQRSEADAKASFKELQAKFPNQLSGHAPIIRRADLGAKGIYYRALVGPYASVEQAAGACSSIKAAGGNCLVQRN